MDRTFPTSLAVVTQPRPELSITLVARAAKKPSRDSVMRSSGRLSPSTMPIWAPVTVSDPALPVISTVSAVSQKLSSTAAMIRVPLAVVPLAGIVMVGSDCTA